MENTRKPQFADPVARVAAYLREYLFPGAHVVLAARTEAEIEAAAAEIRADGGAASTLVLDVTDAAAVRAAIEAEAPFDVLVNNAGTNRPRTFLDVTEDDYDVIAGLNQRAAFFTAQAVARKMAAAGIKGSIIHMSSQMGHVGGQRRTVYCMTKHGIEGLTKAMAIDLAQYGIRVNSLCPGITRTPLLQAEVDNSIDPAKTAAAQASWAPIRRVADPREIAQGALFLARDASSFAVGSCLVLDGGYTAF